MRVHVSPQDHESNETAGTSTTAVAADKAPPQQTHRERAEALLDRQDHAVALSMNLVDREHHRTARAQAHATLALADSLERVIAAVRDVTPTHTWGLKFPGSDDTTATADTIHIPVLNVPMRDDARDRRPEGGETA